MDFRLTSLVFLFLPSFAFAWGELGHRTIAEIANNHLCMPARQKAAQILKGESLGDAAVWADDMRDHPEYKFLNPWHFVSMPFGVPYAEAPKSPRGDLVTAMDEYIQILRNGDARQKQMALRLILHFAGDAHQPLHAGERDDHGGNSFDVDWFGFPTNLHSVWDGKMLKKLGMRPDELASVIEQGPPVSVPQLTTEDWVNESSKIAEGVYPHGSKDPRPPRLDGRYMNEHIETVKARLREGGLRTANLLNDLLGCN